MESPAFEMDMEVFEPLLKGSDFLVVIPRKKSHSFHDEDLQNLFYMLLGVVVGILSWHWLAAFGIGLVIFAFVRGMFDERAVIPLTDQSRFLKIRSGRAYSRFYYLDTDLNSLRYKGSRKLQCLQSQLEAVSINEIAEVKNVCDNEVSKAARDHGYSEENCLSLVFDTISGRCLDLVAPSREVRDQWAAGIRQLLLNERRKCHWNHISKIFQEVDCNGDGLVTFDETMELMKRLNIGLQSSYGRELFYVIKIVNCRHGQYNFRSVQENDTLEKTMSKGGARCLSVKEITELFRMVSTRPDVMEVLDKFSERRRILNPVKLKQFLEVEQHENVSIEETVSIINRNDVCPLNTMCAGGFNSYLLSERALIFNYKHRNVYQDMTQPLNHYFIATSHNTYLLKDQLKGPSSVEGYVRALKKGCKCLELDCWDGPNNEPIVYHGHTWTSKILFKDVIEGINKHAFTVSCYPVILSFENHCSVEQQRVMASHLRNIFGDKLLSGSVTKDVTSLPSPESLKGKILIKGKKLSSSANEDELSEDEEDDYGVLKAAMGEISPGNPTDVNGLKNGDEKLQNNLNSLNKAESEDAIDDEVGADDNSGGDENENTITSTSQMKKSPSALKMVKQALTTNRSNSKEARESGGGDTAKNKKKKIKVDKEWSDLITWCQSVSFENFKHSKEKQKCYEMCSFEEKKSLKLVKNEGLSFVQYNQRHLSRIYPAGTRVDSSNYKPEALWNVGCQLVALNYQTSGVAMELNQGKFLDNGRCGYLLKPEYMRRDNCSFEPRLSGEEHQSPDECITLKVKIISGHQIPKLENTKPERDLFVAMKIYGVDADGLKTRTKTVRNSGYNPMWNDTVEAKIWRPDLALVKFSVKEGDSSRSSSKHSGTQIGQFVLSFQSIMKGYRQIPLFYKSGDKIENSSIFVHVEILSAPSEA